MTFPNKILVTGSSGFIGTYLVNVLSCQGNTVYGLDIRVPISKASDYCFVQCDIRNVNALRNVLADFQPQAIIHLAARTDLDGEDVADYPANVEGVHNLAKAVSEAPSVKRCIFTSSQLVCRVGYVPKNEYEYCPNTAYGKSKVLTETIVREADGGGTEWCIVRPTTVWGPGMNEHYRSFFRMIEKGLYFHIGNKPLFKSYSFVGNIVYQYQKLLNVPMDKIHGKTFYLADYEPIALQEWVDSFQKELMARRIPTLHKKLAKALAKSGDLLNLVGFSAFPFNTFRLNNILTEYQFDTTEIENITGPLPYSMSQGVRETVGWLQDRSDYIAVSERIS